MLAVRLPFAASSGALVTLTVFGLLWHFVSVPIDAGPPRPAPRVDFTRIRIDTPVEVKRDEKTQRPTPPPVPNPPRVGNVRGIEPPTSFERVTFDPVRPGRNGGIVVRPDGDVMPIVRPAPEYPPREITKGTEGWVRVRFTVTAAGTVKDAIVVDAEPHTVFDAAALKAIARWRYNPKVEGGIAVERVGLQTIIRFQLDR